MKNKSFKSVQIRQGKTLLPSLLMALMFFSSASAEYTVEKNIFIDKHGGVELYGDMYIPEGKGPFPVILFFHGGGFIGGQRSDGSLVRLYENYLSRGYAIFTADYRLLLNGGLFPENVKDGKCALAWLKRNGAKYGMDVNRVGTMGESAGGYMAAMVALTPGVGYPRPDCGSADGVDMAVKAVAAYYAPFNFETMQAGFAKVLKIEIRRQLKLKSLKQMKEYTSRNSPITYVYLSPPIILLNTEKDKTVDPEQGDEMAEALRKAGKIYEHVVERGEGMDHGFVLTAYDSPQAKDAIGKSLAFLDKYLKNSDTVVP